MVASHGGGSGISLVFSLVASLDYQGKEGEVRNRGVDANLAASMCD